MQRFLSVYAFFFGLLSSLGQAPHEFLWAFALGVAGFLWLNDYRFRTGFFFGLGYWIGVLYWIVFSFDVYDHRRFGIVSVLGLCVYLAFYKGLAAAVAGKSSFPKIVFCLLWVAFEFVQGHFFQFAFPWGYASFIWPSLEILQSVVWLNVYGLSLVTLLAIVMIFFGSRYVKIFAFVGMGGLWLLGHQRMNKHPTVLSSTHLRLIQPCITQKDKHNFSLFQRNLDIHLAISNFPSKKPLHAILWPETAFLSWMSQKTANYLHAKLTQPLQAYLVTGTLHKNGSLVSFFQKENPKGCMFNSVFVLKENDILQHYAKQRLVPFGEFDPFCIGEMAFDSFTSGKEDKIITLTSLPAFRPFICFEAIFPVPVTKEKWRLNLTNEAWYGNSPGPHQHLKIAQIRTLEANIPLVRVGNNGISCVIDNVGRILWKLDLNRVGFIDFQLPQ